MKFEWDSDKAFQNVNKHGVTFAEAQSVFDDPLYLDYYDDDHSESEQRFIRKAHSIREHLLVVSYTDRDGIIRIISARKATRKEKLNYESEFNY